MPGFELQELTVGRFDDELAGERRIVEVVRATRPAETRLRSSPYRDARLPDSPTA